MPNGFDRAAAILLRALALPDPETLRPEPAVQKPKRARRPAKKRAKGAK
ncbi:MAG TPA: hypothetical protein VK550_13540 [Polyangiaceae bacterium]|nr:hypothetical protein [Polyangiaceae bacterium]